jgi:phosphoribosylanthranilate isomerase
LPNAIRVKICGITNVEDARAAVDLGAWAIGMIFHEGSPRGCDLEEAAAIASALKRKVELVGVFVNAPLDDVMSVLDSVPLTIVQLHGDEGPSYCDEARRRTGVKLMKAMRVRDGAAVRALSAYHTDFHLMDSHVPGTRGGTGQRFDWRLAAEHPGQPPLVLSGGLEPENVGEAIEVARPFAVDVASGVEAVPGRKDPEKLRRFFESVERSAAPV